MDKVRVSIVIVSYNCEAYLLNCLKSIMSSNLESSFEIIVVDNASTDGSQKFLSNHFSEVKLIQNRTNLGFGKANNQAAKSAKGEYLLFLNSDTTIINDSINQLLHQAKEAKADIASCQLINPDNTIQPQGGYLPNITTIANWMLFLDDLPLIGQLFPSYQMHHPSWFTKDRQGGWVAGTAMLVNRASFLKLAGFDEQIFMYAEDVDLCFRGNRNHLKICYFSQPKIFHYSHAGGDSTSALLGEYRGLLYVLPKYLTPTQFSLVKLLLKLGAFLRVVLFGIIHKDDQKKAIYSKAYSMV